MSDEAKAIQEVAKAASTAISAGEKFGSFLSRVFGEPIETTVGMLQDKLTVTRWERQLRLADRVQEIVRERGIDATILPVPPRLALPIIQKASLETDDYLQDLWARLLASCMDPKQANSARSAFIGIIQEIEVIDAKVLEYIFSQLRNYSRRNLKPLGELSPLKVGIRKEDILSALSLAEDRYHLSIDNLMRLRLLVSFSEDSYFDVGDESIEASYSHGYKRVCMTSLGVSFVLACTPAPELESDEKLIVRLREERKASELAKNSALDAALSQIEKQFGSGTMLRAKNDPSHKKEMNG
jgi:hypothetical protein